MRIVILNGRVVASEMAAISVYDRGFLYGDSVFLISEDGTDKDGKPVLKVKRTPVKPGKRFDNKVAIESGLKPGDRVAGSGQLKLFDGATVLPATADALATPAAVPTN